MEKIFKDYWFVGLLVCVGAVMYYFYSKGYGFANISSFVP